MCYKLISFLLLLTGYQASLATEIAKPATAMKAADYKNKPYHFSFTLPNSWAKQSGDVNATNALFMQMPLTDSCSFQFNIIPMPVNFPAERAVNSALKTATAQIKHKKLLSAKRRDFTHEEKVILKEKLLVKEKGKFKEKIKEKEVVKTVLFMRGWEMTERGQRNGLQRIIYQGYDKENHYFTLIAAATTEKFAQCQPQLRQIMDSVLFGQ